MGASRGVIVSLERRRAMRQIDRVHRILRRIVDVPDHLLEEIFGLEPQYEPDDYDAARAAGWLSGTPSKKQPRGEVERG